jgi:hypothetical protein
MLAVIVMAMVAIAAIASIAVIPMMVKLIWAYAGAAKALAASNSDSDRFRTALMRFMVRPVGIKKAYRVLAHKYHPDVSDDPDGEDKFKDVGEAYKTLKLPATRTAYDRLVSPWQGRRAMEWSPVDYYAGWSVLSWMNYWIE